MKWTTWLDALIVQCMDKTEEIHEYLRDYYPYSNRSQMEIFFFLFFKSFSFVDIPNKFPPMILTPPVPRNHQNTMKYSKKTVEVKGWIGQLLVPSLKRVILMLHKHKSFSNIPKLGYPSSSSFLYIFLRPKLGYLILGDC
jgi:hypothetical protein